MKKFLGVVAVAVFAAMAAAQAQDYPNKPIRLIVPYPPGAGADIAGRLVAEALGPRLGQPVVVENKAGAGGLVGTDLVAKSAPDGYTLGWPSADPVTMVPAVKPNMPYKSPEDFSYIAKIAETGYSFVISANVPAKTMAEFVAYAKANPGKLKFGSSGIGGGSHLGTLLFQKHAGVEMKHIPYRGVALALTDLLGGHIDMCYVTPATIAPHVNNDKLRIIAITTPTRHPLLPNVPTMKEVGLPGVAIASWYGLVGPAKLPAPIQERLRKAVAEIVAMPAVQEKMVTTALQLAPLYGADFEKLIVEEIGRWKALAEAENIVVLD